MRVFRMHACMCRVLRALIAFCAGIAAPLALPPDTTRNQAAFRRHHASMIHTLQPNCRHRLRIGFRIGTYQYGVNILSVCDSDNDTLTIFLRALRCKVARIRIEECQYEPCTPSHEWLREKE